MKKPKFCGDKKTAEWYGEVNEQLDYHIQKDGKSIYVDVFNSTIEEEQDPHYTSEEFRSMKDALIFISEL